MSRALKPVTAEMLLELRDDDGRLELISGEVRREPLADHHHGDIAMCIAWRLAAFVEQNQLGKTFAAGTGFLLHRNPDTVRAPDVSFVTQARLPATRIRGFFPGPPDLAAEVISPNDSYAEVEEKVFHWLDAGCKVVLIINPASRDVAFYRSRAEIRILTGEDRVELPDLVPGWSVQVAEIFADD